MATKKKKVVSAIAAVATSAALLLGGTLAWQSANQVALNEASDVINPGGRLHDDFNGENKDVYVENFTDPETGDPIYARVRLEEYFEIVTNYKTAAEKVHTLVGTATATETDAASTDNTGESIVNIGEKYSGDKYERTYATYIFTEENVASGDAAVDADGNAWWKWTLGGQTDYMPTYNLNKDSLMADVNGKFDGAVGTITDRDATDPDAQYTADRQADFPYVEYTAGDTKEAYEVYDGDPNNIDEVSSQAQLLDMIENGSELYPDNIVLSENKEVHTAATTLEGSLMSMAQWIAAGSQPGPYWVYDTDGWVYWAQAIQPGTATGLLLNGIELNQVMDDTWYYAINVVAQFVTADDVGKFDNTGFYDTNKGSAPTGDAETLLEKIGVNMSEGPAEDEDPGEEEEQFTVVLDSKIVSSISGNAEPTTNKATLYEYGEPYAGTVTWGIEAVYGNVDATTIDETGAITIGNEQLGTESDEHEIFRVIAYIDGVEAASEKMMVQAFRSSNYPVHGFRFYQNGTEVAADQLVTGVTYDLESYVYFLSTNSETLANGDPLSDYAKVIPAGELANVAIYTGQSTQIAPPVAAFENATFTANEANDYHITDEQLNLPDYMVWQFVTVSDAGSEISQLSSVKMTAGGMLDNYTWENLPYLPSDAAGSVTLTAYDEQDNALTDGITWSANSSMVSVADGVVSATQDAAAISSTVEEITITADDANGGSADFTVYLYNANGHMYFGTVENENGTYYAFTPSGSGVPVMDDEPALYCISKKGAAPIRYFEYFANSTTAGMLNRLVQAYEDIAASGSTADSAVTDHGLCPHIGGSSGEEERTIATAYLATGSGNEMVPPYLIQKDESYTVKAKNPDGSDFDDENPTLPEGYENARSVWMFYYNGELVNDSQTPLEFTGDELAFSVGMSGSDAANVVTLDWAYMVGTSLADLIPLADMDGAHFYVYNYNTHTFLQSYDHGEETYYLFEGANGEGNICAIKVGSIATDFLDTGAATVDAINFDNAANWGTACGGHGSSNTDPIITAVKSDYAHYENGNVYVAPNSQVEFYCEGENLTDANITWELTGYGEDGSPIALDESFNLMESPTGVAAITVSHNTCMDYEQCGHQPYYYTLSARLDGQEAVSFEKTIYPYELNFWTLTCGAEVEENGKQHIYLAPGETLTFTFTAPNGITNEQASWQFLREYEEEGTGNGLVKEGGFTLTEVGDRSATLSHDCESAEACVHETHLSHHLQVYADGTSMSKDTITIWMYAEPVTVELMESSDQLPYPSTYATLPVNTAVRLVCAENDADLSSVNTEITVRNESGAPGTASLSSDKYTYDESSHIIKFTDPSLAGDLITVVEAGNNYGKLFWLVEETGSSPFTVSLSADAEEFTVGSSEDITFTATVTVNDPDSGCTPSVVFIELPLTDEGYPYDTMYMSPAEGDSNTFTFTRNTANLTEDFTATAYTGGAVSQPVTIKAVPAPTYDLSLSSTASQYPAGGSLEVTLTAAVTADGTPVDLSAGDITWTAMAGENDITAALTDNGNGTATLNTAGQSSDITVTTAYGDEASNSVTIAALANEEGEPTFSAADVTHTKTLASNLAPDSTVNVYAGTEVQLRSSNSSTDWEVEGAEIAKAGYNSEEGAAGSFFHINVAEDAAGTQVTVTQTVGEDKYAITLNVKAVPYIKITDVYDSEVAALGTGNTEYGEPDYYTLTLMEGDTAAADADWTVTWADGSAIPDSLTLTDNNDGTATLTIAAYSQDITGTLKITSRDAVKYAPVNYYGNTEVVITYEPTENGKYYTNTPYSYTYRVFVRDSLSEPVDVTQYYTDKDIVFLGFYDDEDELVSNPTATIEDGIITATAPGTYYPQFTVKGESIRRAAEITFIEYVPAPENATDNVIVTIRQKDGSDVPETIAIGLSASLSLDAVASYADGSELHETHRTVSWSLSGQKNDETYISDGGSLYVSRTEKADTLTVTATVTVDDGMEGRTQTVFTASCDIDVVRPTTTFSLEGDGLTRDENGNYSISIAEGGTAYLSFVSGGKVTAPDGKEYDVIGNYYHAHSTDTVSVNLIGDTRTYYGSMDGNTVVEVTHQDGDVTLWSGNYTVILQIESEYEVDEYSKGVAEAYVTLTVTVAE